MTLEESKEAIPMMEAMITQIEEQQNIISNVYGNSFGTQSVDSELVSDVLGQFEMCIRDS